MQEKKNSYGKFKLGQKGTLIDIIEKNESIICPDSLSNSGIVLSSSIKLI